MRIVIVFKAIFLLKVLAPTASKTIEGNLPNASLLTNLINEYVKPYINSLDSPQNPEPAFRTSKKKIEDIILQKVLELKPFLKEDKIYESEEKLTLDDGEETTIIEYEFTPDVNTNKAVGRNRKENVDEFKADIEVYKKLREKVTKALKKESVTDKTLRLVTKTFDGLIAKLIGSQCMWKSSGNADKTFRFGRTVDDELLNIRNITKEQWEKLKQQYMNITTEKVVNGTVNIFNKMKGFFSSLINNTMAITHKYTARCQLVENKTPTKEQKHYLDPNILRDHNDGDECAYIEICANELTIYLTDFYNSLNDTAVSAFRNYAAMYSRDVTSDRSVEKEYVVNLINNISNRVEKKIIRIFEKETKAIKLDEHNNKEVNIKILMRYINSTIGHIKKHIKKHLEKYLKSLKLRLLLNVKRDIDVNLSVDLGNLARDFVSRICTVFITCNGKYLSRRAKNILNPWGNLHVKDGKSVYVKLQLNLDDALKNTIVKNRNILTNTFKGNYRRNLYDKYNNFHVTRTTPEGSTGSSTTKTDSVKNPNKDFKMGGSKIVIEMKELDNAI